MPSPFDDERQPDPEFRKLYPHLTDEELIEAQKNFDEYLAVVWRIFLRIRENPEEYAKFKRLVKEQKKMEELKRQDPDPPLVSE